MTIEDKTAKLITQLIRETAKGSIKWLAIDAPRSLNSETEQSVPLYLQTEYKGKKLGVFDLREKYFTDVDEFYWTQKVGFCIVDSMGRVVWEMQETTPSLVDLFSIAREQAAGIDDILNELLND